MEITSFILGVCTVIVIMMIVGTSVNHMTIKVLRKEIKNLTNAMERNSEDLYRQLEKHEEAREKLHSEVINYTDGLNNNVMNELNNVYGHIDSRVDKLDGRFTGEIKRLLLEQQALSKEVSRVETGYKEKINY
jgi:predicted PurR-regulated permease PerM